MAIKHSSWTWTLLFTTSATLVCCALPILLVSLGMGTVVASLASSAPWLITLSMYKGWVFAVSGLLIAASAWVVQRAARTCPADPVLRQACETATRWNTRFLWLAGGMWAIGFFYAFILVRIYE